MLLNLHKKSWMDGLMLADYSEHSKLNETTVRDMLDLAKNYNKVTLRLWTRCVCLSTDIGAPEVYLM
jgi:hypothetical protein